jgi:glucose/mannose transport system permease protein
MSTQTATAEQSTTLTDRLTPGRVALYGFLVTLAALYLSPLQAGLMTAFKTQDGFIQTVPYAPPLAESTTLEGWRIAWDRLSFSLVNSFLMVVPATILSALFGSMTAYGLTKVDWRGQLPVVLLLLAAIFIPYQAVLVPLRLGWSAVGLAGILGAVPLLGEWLVANTGLIELTITHTAYGIPICTILFRTYYQSMDDEMLEAARLDGATIQRIYRKIVLPLSVPMFAVTLIYQFTQIWNDFLISLVVLDSPENYVVTLQLNALTGSMTSEFNVQMAGAFIAALPTILVYIAFGEQFAKGATV